MLNTGQLFRMLFVSCPRLSPGFLSDGQLNRDAFAPGGIDGAVAYYYWREDIC